MTTGQAVISLFSQSRFSPFRCPEQTRYFCKAQESAAFLRLVFAFGFSILSRVCALNGVLEGELVGVGAQRNLVRPVDFA